MNIGDRLSTILSQLKPLKIGDLTAKLPIIQGGMGVGISLSSLAGAVAGAGGIGIISTAQIGFREPDFAEHPQEANLRAIGSELQKSCARYDQVSARLDRRFNVLRIVFRCHHDIKAHDAALRDRARLL